VEFSSVGNGPLWRTQFHRRPGNRGERIDGCERSSERSGGPSERIRSYPPPIGVPMRIAELLRVAAKAVAPQPAKIGYEFDLVVQR
jgi:hypothetical protein